MQIALLTGATANHPDIPALVAKINEAGVSYVTRTDGYGDIRRYPCIAALDDARVARKSWDTSAPIAASEITTQAGIAGTPQTPPFKRFMQDEFAKALADVIGADNFATCWGNTKFQIYMSLTASFGKDDAATTAALAGAVASGGMSNGQRTGILNQWPTV